MLMKVGDEEMIDPAQPGFFLDHLLDAHRVAVVEAAKTRVHQHGLTLRSHDERRGAPFDVNPVDIERARHRGCRQYTDGQRRREQHTRCERARCPELHVQPPLTVL